MEEHDSPGGERRISSGLESGPGGGRREERESKTAGKVEKSTSAVNPKQTEEDYHLRSRMGPTLWRLG